MVDKKAEILKCGKTLFSTKGFKDTNVADITKMAEIATGTFYLYYSSKEKLFMEIFMEENVKLKKAILESVNIDEEPMSVIQELIQKNMDGMASNPILREWYNRDVFNKVEEKFREENGLEHVDFMYSSFAEIIKKWQADEKIRGDIDSGMIMALFSAVVIIDVHKDEIGFEYFPKIQDYLTEFILKGLTDCSGPATPKGKK